MIRLLVVDDNEQNRLLLQALLIRRGYSVSMASDGTEALKVAREDPPAMVITDILMPGMDGYTLCRQWKQDEKLKGVPLVFYTATYTDLRDMEFALSLGADRFIIKPKELDSLVEVFEEVLAEHKGGRKTHALIPAPGEAVYLKEYNETLIRKLEDKLVEVEAVNARLNREIADRMRAETETVRVEHEWQRTFDATNSAVWILDEEQRIVRSNMTSERFFGVSCRELIGKRCWEIVHDTNTAISDCPIFRARESLQRETRELQIGPGWFEVTVDPILNANGQYAGAVHTVSDINERKRSEHDLLASETRYRRLFESAKDGILILDAETGSIVDVNPYLIQLLGFDREDLLQKKLWEIGLFKDIVASELAFAELQEKEYIRYEDLPLETKSGKRIEVEFVSNVYLVDSTRVIQCNIRDITEQKSLEEQLHQSQKMESIGQLAGGVAHDFNNILQAIIGYSGLLLDILPEREEPNGYVKEIMQGAEHAASLTRQLLAFSRRQILVMEDCELKDVVSGLTKMIRRIIGESVEVVLIEGRNAGVVHADRGQLEQVLLNLCINARDAMPEGGVLTIATEKVVMTEEYCASHVWASPGRYVLLSVTDTGCGIDAETQARIFEPFFTTKGLGKGTGLGLATVYGVVRQHQGMIRVCSELGKGTTFRVYIPSYERSAAREEVHVVTRARGGIETILVAEDDEVLQGLVTKILEHGGYTVLLAVNGEDALKVYEEHAADIALCLLDVVMPKMGGKAVYDILHPKYPDCRFVFSSGYSMNAIHKDFVLQEGIELIEKPYPANDLLCKVREVLDRRT